MLRFRCCLVALTRRFADIRRVYSCMGVASPRSLCHLIVRTCVCCKIVCNSCLRVFAHCFGCSHILFFSFSGREIFRTILEACNTFGFICYTERNFIAFERVLFLSGVDKKKRREFFNYLKIIKKFRDGKKSSKECIKLLSSCKNFVFSRLLIIFRIFRIFIRVDLILKKN